MKIKSGATSDYATIDSTSKALRIIRYDDDGNALQPPPTGVYMIPFNLSLTANFTGVIWGIRNGPSSTVSMYIRTIFIRSAFLSTILASQGGAPFFTVFNGANLSGGNSLTPIKLQSGFASSQVSDARQTAGAAALTTTGTSIVSQLYGNYQPKSPGANNAMKLKFYEPYNPKGMLTLAAGEGLYINITTNNQNIVYSGYILWEER